jgi:hypothetical protein
LAALETASEESFKDGPVGQRRFQNGRFDRLRIRFEPSTTPPPKRAQTHKPSAPKGRAAARAPPSSEIHPPTAFRRFSQFMLLWAVFATWLRTTPLNNPLKMASMQSRASFVPGLGFSGLRVFQTPGFAWGQHPHSPLNSKGAPTASNLDRIAAGRSVYSTYVELSKIQFFKNSKIQKFNFSIFQKLKNVRRTRQ